MKKAVVLTLFVVLMNSTLVLAQADTAKGGQDFSASYDAFIRTTMDQLKDVPGVAVFVIKDDKPIFLRAYGIADLEAGKKADTDTLFYIASSNKAFTALAAAMLDKEGKIRFSDPVTKYTSGVQFKDPIPDKITVRDLLIHTSGLRNSALVQRTAFTGEIDKKDIDYAFANGTSFDEKLFGTYRYTNLGYNIYGILLENNLKLKWQDALRKRIFEPMGLKRTTARRSHAVAKKWSIAAPYVFNEATGTIERSTLDKTDNNMHAAGGMFMSISDLGRWLNLNMNDGRLDGKQVIPAELIRNAQTGYTKNTRTQQPFTGDGEYGLGWQIGKYRGEKVIYHHGGYSGYRSHVSFLPDKKIAVGVLVNNDHVGGGMADTIATYAYDKFLGRDNVDAEYTKKVNDFVEMYAKRKQQVMASAAERAKRTSQLTQPLAAYVGTYKNDLFGTTRVDTDGKTLTVRMGLQFAHATPFTDKDSIRVVMEPGGNGEIIKFAVTDRKVTSLNYSDIIFTRVP